MIIGMYRVGGKVCLHVCVCALEKSKTRIWQHSVSGRAPSLACRGPPSHCVRTWWRESKLFRPLQMGPNPSPAGPSLCPHLTLIASKKALSPNTVTLRGKCSAKNFYSYIWNTSSSVYLKESMSFPVYCKHWHFKNKMITLFLNNSIEAYLIYHTIYPLKEYDPIAFNIFTKLCIHQHNQFQNISITSKRNLTRLSCQSPIVSPPSHLIISNH